MKLNVDEKALFEPYLSTDYLRPMLHEPILKDGYVCATDTYSILRIHQDLLAGEYSEKPYTPNVSKVLTPPNFDKVLTLAKLERAIAKCPCEDEMELESHEIECSECDGDGEVEWGYTDKNHHIHTEWYECPVCHGSGVMKEATYRKTGRKVPNYEAGIEVFGLVFWAELLLRLCDTMKALGINEVRYVSRYEGNANIFNLADGIDVVLMPLADITSAVKYE